MVMTPEKFDQWRPVPRLIVALYVLMFYRVVEWFMTLPDPTGPQSGFVYTVVGAGAAFFGFYVNAKPTVHKSDVRET